METVHYEIKSEIRVRDHAFRTVNKRNIGCPGQNWHETSKGSRTWALGAFLVTSKCPSVGSVNVGVALLVSSIDPKILGEKPKNYGGNTAFKRDFFKVRRAEGRETRI